jgi:3-phenylpropionate/trans-cinnamate dioxygenase ferredoxin subunit
MPDGIGFRSADDASTGDGAAPASGGVTATEDADAGGFTRVASLDELPEGTLYGVEAGGRRICLVNVEGEIYALQDNCSHQDFPLSAGCLEDGRVECAWHGAKFDPASGRAVALPAIRPVKTYEVRLDGDDILVDLR